MKTYIFKHGRKDAENFSGEEIKSLEKKLGRLEMVVIDGHKKIPVDYRENQIPIEEHAWFKRRETARKEKG